MATNTPPKNVNNTISDIVRSFDKDINRYRIDIGKSQTAYLLDDIRNTALNNIDGIVASIGGDSTALGKEFRSKWTDTINAAYQVRKTQIEKKFKSDQDFLKSRLEEKKNLETQLVKLREISKNKEQKISAEQKKNIQKLITFQKEKIKKIETLQNNVVKKSISIEDAKKEYSDLIEKNKEIDKTIEEYTGVESFKESTNDLERIIEDFLKDQRKSKSVKTFGQTMASHGGVLGVRKAAHAYGLQQGERLRKKISKMFGIGELEKHHERWLEKQLDIYQDELKESGTPEEQAIKQVNDYERNLRSNLSRGVKEKDVLGEKDLSTIAEQSKKTSKYTTKEAKPTAPFINNMAEVHATGGKLSGNLDIVGERGLEIVKGNEVLSPEGNTGNMSKWFTAFKEIAGVKNPKKHPLEVHIIKIKNDVNSIKEFLIESAEDKEFARDKESVNIKDTNIVKDNVEEAIVKNDDGMLSNIISGMVGGTVGGALAKLAISLIPSIIPAVLTFAGFAIVGVAAYSIYKGIKDIIEANEIQDNSGIRLVDQLQKSGKISEDTAKKWKSFITDKSTFMRNMTGSPAEATQWDLVDKIGMLTAERSKYESEVIGTDKLRTPAEEAEDRARLKYYDEQISKFKDLATRGWGGADFIPIIEEIIKNKSYSEFTKYSIGGDSEGMGSERYDKLNRKKYWNAVGMLSKEYKMFGGDFEKYWDAQNAMNYNNADYAEDAIIQNNKVTKFRKDDVVAIGTDLNQSKKGGLSQTLKEAMKDVSTDIINAFNPREMKQITLDMYEKTIAVWQQSEANKKKEASNTIISNTNNNILGGGSSAVREKYIPVELDFVRY